MRKNSLKKSSKTRSRSKKRQNPKQLRQTQANPLDQLADTDGRRSKAAKIDKDSAVKAATDLTVTLPVPPLGQTTDYTCGPIALISTRAFLRGDEKAGEELEHLVARVCETAEDKGTTCEGLLKGAKAIGLELIEAIQGLDCEESVEYLIDVLKRGLPIVVRLQAFAKPGDYVGHWAVVCGYDSKSNVFAFMDPAGEDSRFRQMSRAQLVRRWWHDESGGTSGATTGATDASNDQGIVRRLAYVFSHAEFVEASKLAPEYKIGKLPRMPL